MRGSYTRCYHCNRRRRLSNWHDPERLAGQEERDAELGRTEFYVYVLDTDYGHYVGHTANVQARLGAHRAGGVQSTAGGSPRLLWRSYPFSSREEATRFEAALKSLRDQRAKRFEEITGYSPRPFQSVPIRTGTQRDTPRGGCGLWSLAAITAIIAATLFTLAIF